ncbi:LtrC-like protein [Streptococcus iniae]|uniref:PBECR4 domain-containing protein n=1 Tax=Streptococcus iniae TaxID=1346 RepID=UPI0002E33398|nr:PBECR4 domain-containing protein [Streptococcus iniae]ESR10524.1 hypothetical protein IUSA1_01245 [Streptococcus iniae IUSA1]KYJ81239.1 LtrC-like protein [Streptococcus iniae]RMI73088.1 LtrC-like protein [Streptococcus iniae]HEK4517266.1 toprim domain-containing protein [Streptococcus iniae]
MSKTIEELRRTSILDVATDLGMVLKRSSNHQYYWEEHDSLKISPIKNTFAWYSKDIRGDVFTLVQTIREELTGKKVTFKEARSYLETGEFKQFESMEVPKKNFSYYLQAFEHSDFKEARQYLKIERGLSDQTIDFFLNKGVIAEANHKTDDVIEPVIVFKTLNNEGKVTGGSLQGIRYNNALHERGRLKRLMRASDGLSGMHVDIGKPNRLVALEAPIDLMSYYELHQAELKDVRLLAMDGLKEATIGRHLAEVEAIIANRPVTWSVQELGQSLSKALKEGYFQRESNQNKITLAVDNDKAGHKFIKKLQDRGIKLQVDIPKIQDGEKKADWNDVLKKSKEEKLENNIKNDPGKNQGQEIDRSKISSGSLQENLEGSTLPVSDDTFEQTVTSHPTISYPLLHFSTDNITVSNIRAGYHVASETDLRNLNYYAPALQSTATWYRDVLSNSKVTYLLKGEDNHPKEVIVDFSKDKFAHLTGIRPVGSGLNAEKVLDDLVEGKGDYPNISVSHGFIDKVQVLPLLQEITMSKSFVFDHLEDISKMRSLKASHVIQSENKNLIVALKTVDDVTFPASLLKSKATINNQLIEKAQENEILGVVRQRDNKTEIISINDKYIIDGGQELLEIVNQRGKDLSPKKDSKQEIMIDSDADGLSDEVEYGLGTNPFGEAILDDKPQVTVQELIAENNTKELTKTLKEGVKNFLDSDQYKQFLTTMSKFHNYSLGNIQLLILQNPEVSAVASFKKWKESFGRTVNKGEKSLRVWAPVTVNKKDPKTGEIILNKEGNPIKKTYFKLVPVFDISQTSGKELPRLVNELEGSHQDYANLYRASKEVSLENGVAIEINNFHGEAKGYYSPSENKIVLRPGMSEQQTLKTLFHEMAHSDLHNNKEIKDNPLSRSTKELQAESVAYVVANHYGIDTGEYSFGYLASWSEDKEGLADLEAQLSIVQKEANDLIKRLDTTLEKYKDMNIQKGKFSEKLTHYREKSKEETVTKGGTVNPKSQAKSQNQQKTK